jgi:hypothetical protein
MGSTARLTPTPPIRADLAWRHATESDLQSVDWTIPIARWRKMLDAAGGGGGLSHRALRVLRFYCALHRAGRVGYVGTRASYAAIGAAVRLTTDEAASRSTVIRGVNELRAAGLLDVTRGRGDRVRQIAPGEYIREPIAVITLTETARAIWTERPARAHTVAPVSSCNGYISPRELPGPLQGREATPEREDLPASPTASAVPSTTNAEPASAGVEHRDGGAVALAEPRTSARPVAPLAALADGNAAEDRRAQVACQRQRLRFTSGTRPTSRPLAVSALLSTLASLTRFSGREGAALVARAKAEVAGRSDAPPSGVAWDYWIARWPEMVRDERFRWARAEILPLLRSTRASTSPPRIAAARPPASPPPAARPPAPPSPPPSPPASLPGAPHGATVDPTTVDPTTVDPSGPFAEVLARQLARLAAKTATTCRSSES